MSNDTQVFEARSAGGEDLIANAGRPIAANNSGLVQLQNGRGLRVNSQLRKDEWEELDAAVMEAVKYSLGVVDDIKGRGLTKSTAFGTLTTTWNISSRMGPAEISMDGETVDQRDRVTFDVDGAPVPIVSTGFHIGARQLDASRKMGEALDSTHVYEATRSVMETFESMLMNGSPTVTFKGYPLLGYRTATNRLTDTATNYGGGDWGTLANVVPTVVGMLNAANSYHLYGPFILYVSGTQFNQAALSFHSDGTADTGIARINKLDVDITVKRVPSEVLADGEAVLVQATRDVVEWAEAMPVRVVEWTANDGMASNYRIMGIGAPRIKTRSNGKSGIVHATGL